jgi:adenosine deaminase
MPDAAATVRSLPKVVLHDHLDGGLREATLLELLRERGLDTPAPDAASLARWFDERAHAGSLVEYLRGFALTVAAMASPAALARVAREAAEDARADGAVLAEFRIAPLLFEAHGLSGETAVEALLEGLADAPLPCGLIVCAMRERDAPHVERSARLALRYRDRGVIGFDLAGAEAGHPPGEHAPALALVRDAGLPITLHAGEADAAPRVLEAVRLGAARIGHGVRLADALDTDAALVQAVRDAGVHLEVCPTSNVHTGAARSLAEHPIVALWRAGFSLSFHTDNRLMSRVSQSDEALALLRETPLTPADLLAMQRQAAQHSFLPAPARQRAAAALDAWAAQHADAWRAATDAAAPPGWPSLGSA